MLLLCRPKSSAKAARPMLIKISQNLYYRPEKMQKSFYYFKSQPQFDQNPKSFPKAVVFIFCNQAVCPIWGRNLKIKGLDAHTTTSLWAFWWILIWNRFKLLRMNRVWNERNVSNPVSLELCPTSTAWPILMNAIPKNEGVYFLIQLEAWFFKCCPTEAPFSK